MLLLSAPLGASDARLIDVASAVESRNDRFLFEDVDLPARYFEKLSFCFLENMMAAYSCLRTWQRTNSVCRFDQHSGRDAP